MTQSSEIEQRHKELDRIFYESDSISGYNQMFNVVMGGRGCGKTFNFKRKFLRQKGETVWVRRYDKDFDKENQVIETFMTDLLKEGYFTEDVVVTKNNILYLNGEPKIYFIPLSTSLRFKSVSFANVDNIVFDEFIETRRNRSYLPNEVELLYDLVETVNRLRLGRPEVKVWMLANKVSFDNPYFLEWGVKEFPQRFQKFKGGLLVVESYENRDFIELKKQSRFGRFIEGTKYAQYQIENKNLRDTNDFIAKHSGTATCLVSIRLRDKVIGLWVEKNGDMYVSDSYDKNRFKFALNSDLREGERALKSNKKPMTWLRDSMNEGKLYYESSILKATVRELMGECLK